MQTSHIDVGLLTPSLKVTGLFTLCTTLIHREKTLSCFDVQSHLFFSECPETICQTFTAIYMYILSTLLGCKLLEAESISDLRIKSSKQLITKEGFNIRESKPPFRIPCKVWTFWPETVICTYMQKFAQTPRDTSDPWKPINMLVQLRSPD